MGKPAIAIIGGDAALQKVVSDLVAPYGELTVLSSVVDLPRILSSSAAILVAEVNAECSGLELLEILAKVETPELWFIAADNLLRETAFGLGVAEYFPLPVGVELVAKLRKLKVSSHPAALTASGETVSLFSLIQFLFSTQMSGALRIAKLEKSGVVFLEKGQIVHVEFSNLTGEAALLALLSLKGKELQFVLDRNGSTALQTVEKRTDHLLLELASRIDEKG